MASRLTWIVFLLAVALFGLFAKPLVLGLDLQGGVTMRYELEPPTDRPIEDLQPGELAAMVEATADRLRGRIDVYGIKESGVTTQGERELIIELPGSTKEEAQAIKSLVGRVGRLEFRIFMRADGTDDDARNSIVISEEHERLAELLAREENVGQLPDDIQVAELEHNIPDQQLVYRWYPKSDELIAMARGADVDELDADAYAALVAERPLTVADYHFVRIDLHPERNFTGADVDGALPTQDARGNPAVGVNIKLDRASAFGDWTEPNAKKLMGIILDGRVGQSPAEIEGRLEDYFVISSGQPGGFSSNEINAYLTLIKSGSLQMKPTLLFENSVGPSLGEASISAGLSASVAGFIAVLLFMLLYYRLNGAIAGACLVLNMVLLGGFLMFLGATLTLPGIAGLVLTLGMAVDANILVFERMREESDRAKSVGQAVKLGFEKAFSTIVDANVTSFVTAFILYKVGTGPVRGFAVILMLGIFTSVFSVLVIQRVIYDWLVDRGLENIAMGRLIKKQTSIGFMAKARTALKLSAVVVVISLFGFFAADRDKYGLDFLGGYKAQVRLSEPATQAEVSEALSAHFDRVQVVSVVDEEAEPGSSTGFVIKIKATPEVYEQKLEGDAMVAIYAPPVRAALGDRLLPDGVSEAVINENPATDTTRLEATLNFAGPVTPEQVEGALSLANATVTANGPQSVRVAGDIPGVGLDPEDVKQVNLRTPLAAAAKGQNPLPKLSEPFVESTTIGARVGTELRDSAIRAILLSFIAIVLYIRVRFREYRYGWAAIIALFHDVSITLGVVALVHFTGVIDVEIDLAMIAAFLTIIGYSLNDTIVLFDRVRENLPRLTDKTYEEVLDISINQTLSRTLLTSLTTLTALVIIFAFNYGRQNVLEGFSFAMILGVLVGTYSSIFVAAPVLRMLPEGRVVPSDKKQTKSKSNPATGVPT